jgi:hypothetical protein
MAMMCNALFTARSRRIWAMTRDLPDEAGTGLTPHSAAKLASVDSFRIVASGQQELGSRLLSIEVRQKIWSQLLDDGADHHVRSNLIVKTQG